MKDKKEKQLLVSFPKVDGKTNPNMVAIEELAKKNRWTLPQTVRHIMEDYFAAKNTKKIKS